jgi:hypothetical protein
MSWRADPAGGATLLFGFNGDIVITFFISL